MSSKIQYCDETWNPVIGCTKVSEGCANCYAERMACRLAYMGQRKYESVLIGKENVNYGFFPRWNNKVVCDEKALNKPLHWRKPRRIFVNSMSDTFHPAVPFSFIDKIVDVAEKCPQHTLQFLTKRASIMYDYSKYRDYKWPKNIIGMVTAENQERADWCIPYLLQCGFKTTGVSIEPMLGGINLHRIKLKMIANTQITFDSLSRKGGIAFGEGIGLDWIILGGESGPKARPMHPDWVRNIRDQCVAANVPFFFKQWGEYTPNGPGRVVENDVVFLKDGTLMSTKEVFKNGWQKYYDTPTDCVWMKRVGKKKAGCLLDGKEWKQYPERIDNEPN